jgi:hypothetical protein
MWGKRRGLSRQTYQFLQYFTAFDSNILSVDSNQPYLTRLSVPCQPDRLNFKAEQEESGDVRCPMA